MSGSVVPPHIEGRFRWKNANRIEQFGGDRRGNIAMIFAIMLSLLFLFIGGSIDYGRYNSIRTDTLESLDAASLAIVRMEEKHGDWTPQQLVEYGERFFLENSKNEGVLLKADHTPYANIDEVVMFDLVSDDTKVKACVDGSIATHLLAVVNIKYLEVSQCSVVTKAGAGRVELALVLDMTGSMKTPPGGISGTGEIKRESLKKAVVSMLDVLFGDDTQSDNVKVGVVPFNTHVNAGQASSWDPAWGDLNADSLYHGKRFVHVDENGILDPYTKVNHYRLYDSDRRANWRGCVEARPYPLDELDTPPGSSVSTSVISDALVRPSTADEPDSTVLHAFNGRPNINPNHSLSQLSDAANSRFVPVFLGDGPDCDNPAPGGGLCAVAHNTPMWEVTTSLSINGMPNIDQIHARNRYSRPDSRGFSEDKYWLRFYIKDEEYIGESSGEKGARYAYVVDQFRALKMGNRISPVQQALRDHFKELGVDIQRFADDNYPDPSSTHTEKLKYDEFVLRGAYVGWWNPVTNTYIHKYDATQFDDSITPEVQDCPPAIVPLTDNRLLIDGGDANDDGSPDGGIMYQFGGSGYTNIPNGLMWGWRVVSDGLPFTESTGPNDIGPNGTSESDWKRAVVLMTDGENLVTDISTHFGSHHYSYGYAHEERMGPGINDAAKMIAEMDNKMLRICRRMKQENIDVYAVVFDIQTGSNIDTKLKSCASSPTSPYYFNVTDGDDLREAFEDIAESLTSLHVSQ